MLTVQEIAQQIVKLCQEQKAQELDKLIDNFVYNPKPNQPDFDDLLDHIANELKDDHTTAAWFCSFMSGEIELLFEESPHPIQDLSKLLLDERV